MYTQNHLKLKKNPSQFSAVAIAAALITFANPGYSQDSDAKIVEELKACATTENTVERSVCYENLGNRVVNAGAETKAEVLPDSLGGGDFAEKAGAKEQVSRGLVTSCKKTLDKRKWFYFFDNDQVWKQVDSRKRNHRECNFGVSITKDSFGYVMRIDDQKSKIRIERIR